MNDENLNCCLDRGSDRFRYRVGAIIIENGCVLLATNDTADYYYSVGGGVHLGETAHDAALREVKEETGVDYEVERLAFIHENFFTCTNGSNKGKRYHELSLYFLMKPRGTQEIHSDSICLDGKEYLEWIPLDKLKDKKVFPEFFAEKLARLPEHVEMLLTK